MCGICGIWNAEERPMVETMVERMRHRGPDEDGFYDCENGTLGHARLSIMDPTGGRQPIFNEDKSLAVIANGEIYNYPKLRQKLTGKHSFKTNNDSEVLLHLFEEKGPEMVKLLDGMFAFCITDGKSIFLARDPIGIKPLYWGRKKTGKVLFTSEQKTSAGEDCLLSEFPPGCTYSTTRGMERYFTLASKQAEQLPIEQHVSLLRNDIDKAVHKRLMSDVPVGCFLSGGLDSSIISAVVAQEKPDLHTFSVGLEGSSDLEAAQLVASHIGSKHHQYIITKEEIVAELPRIIYHLESFDQDLVRSSIPTYFTAKLAAQEVKVILTGEGADELFGGYTYYRSIADHAQLHKELLRSIKTLHNINLQRVDRITMAHSIEARVPFLDLKVIETAQRIPVELKLNGTPPAEKWILRKTYEKLLPEKIVWRPKEQFDEGTGMTDLLPQLTSELFSDEQAGRLIKKHPEARLRSKEEAYYFLLFQDLFRHDEQMVRQVARWGERPDLE
ncbi:asparagine synthase B [Sediminispirochaeta bajacaliforniensis]|uniref:asparagine synthase B n=1 Tax=Sediminispirochaeta bajacaliforniensis TaxID=148 RepID=UPI00039E518B|nr:asparagine synthase B [Sediminispirochaeta bajacaliforniensis]